MYQSHWSICWQMSVMFSPITSLFEIDMILNPIRKEEQFITVVLSTEELIQLFFVFIDLLHELCLTSGCVRVLVPEQSLGVFWFVRVRARALALSPSASLASPGCKSQITSCLQQLQNICFQLFFLLAPQGFVCIIALPLRTDT